MAGAAARTVTERGPGAGAEPRAGGRALLLLAGLFGAVGVAAGAFAAHGLEPLKGERAVALWQTASHHQLVHAVALLAIGLAGGHRGLLLAAGGCFAVGCLLFPGALYLLGWFGPSALGAVAPVGGLAFILGWGLVAAAAVRRGPR